MKKIFKVGIIVSVFLVPVLFLGAENLSSTTVKGTGQGINPGTKLENRVDNIERIRTKLASTTASTSIKKIGELGDRLEKQKEQLNKLKDRLVNKELKVISVLKQISDKITARITILEGKSLNMTAAKAKLAEATTKITEMTDLADQLTTLIETTITEVNGDQLFANIKTIQGEIKTMAKETKALLIETVKEITKVLPAKTATTTASSTSN